MSNCVILSVNKVSLLLHWGTYLNILYDKRVVVEVARVYQNKTYLFNKSHCLQQIILMYFAM